MLRGPPGGTNAHVWLALTVDLRWISCLFFMDFFFLVHNFKVCSRISVAGSMSTHDLAAHAHDGCLRCVESMSKRTRLKHAFRQQMDGRADVVSRVGWGGHVVWVGVWLGGLFWVVVGGGGGGARARYRWWLWVVGASMISRPLHDWYALGRLRLLLFCYH